MRCSSRFHSTKPGGVDWPMMLSTLGRERERRVVACREREGGR
jgi:hypothetical protein